MGHFSHFYKMLLPCREDVWIESGTYRGESVDIALECTFRELHSIEVCPRLYEAVAPRFGREARVNLHQGSSPPILDRLLDDEMTSRCVVFWLDAHFQGYESDEQDAEAGECPLLQELDVILGKNWSAPVLLAIDDLPLFKGDAFWNEHPMAAKFKRDTWPRVDAIYEKLSGYTLVETRQCLYAAMRS